MYKCTCGDGTVHTGVSDCEQCSSLCTTSSSYGCVIESNTTTVKTMVGVSSGVFISLLLVSLVLWIALIWFSIHVMRKCHGNPSWLNPTVITLLVLFFLLGWIPGLGILFFITLLILLIVYNNQCVSKRK